MRKRRQDKKNGGGKNDKNDIAFALNNGADDFISKPYNIPELLARVRAGQRQIDLKEKLKEKNLLLEERNQNIAEAYVKIRDDLQTAVFFQQSEPLFLVFLASAT